MRQGARLVPKVYNKKVLYRPNLYFYRTLFDTKAVRLSRTPKQPLLSRVPTPLGRLFSFLKRQAKKINDSVSMGVWALVPFAIMLPASAKAPDIKDAPTVIPVIKQASELHRSTLVPQAQAKLIYIAPKPKPKPATTVVSHVTAAGCGDNSYAHFIYMHESGCRTDAINPIGACGLGQALPCSKMGCSLSDYVCQNKYFTDYALSTYGSWASAYAFWLAHSWW